MLHLRNPERPGDAGRSEQAMHGLAGGYGNAHLQDILQDAAQQRRAQVERPSAIDRIRSAASKVKASLAQHIDHRRRRAPAPSTRGAGCPRLSPPPPRGAAPPPSQLPPTPAPPPRPPRGGSSF